MFSRCARCRSARCSTVLESGISNILGALTVRDSTVSRSRRDGIVNAGTLTLTNSTVAGNSGSGITTSANRVGCSTTTIVGSTISENQGAGLSNCGELTITNSTISQNNDDGIINYGVGALTVANSTVTGGIHVESNDHPQDPQKVIVATATVLQGACTQSGDNVTWTSNGHNIESPGNTCGLDEAKGDQVNISAQDLKIGPLQDNGGRPMTNALPPGSVAIDVIPDEMCNVAEDERGVARPQGDACDVGSSRRCRAILPTRVATTAIRAQKRRASMGFASTCPRVTTRTTALRISATLYKAPVSSHKRRTERCAAEFVHRRRL